MDFLIYEKEASLRAPLELRFLAANNDQRVANKKNDGT